MQFQYVVAYLAAAAVFLIVDALWLGFVAKAFYQQRLSGHLKSRPNLGAAAAFYLVYVCGVVLFAISPALGTGSWETAFLYGLLFGFFCYATYDMTNLATLRDWPVAVVIVDIAWGTLITGLTAVTGYLAASAIDSSPA